LTEKELKDASYHANEDRSDRPRAAVIGREPCAQASEERKCNANNSQQRYARAMKARIMPMMSIVVGLRAKNRRLRLPPPPMAQ
jgi:hypothetical protein